MSDYKLIDVTRLAKFKEKLLGILTYPSPAASTSSTSIEFIDTVSQSNGKISASKKKVSTFAGNTAGLVPAPGTNASGTFLGSNGQWSKPTGTTYNNYTYSSTTKAGAAGLVPQPGTGDVGKFLKGGSGWSDLPVASTSNSGIVSLSSSTNSDAENIAATPKAIKAVYAAASTAGATAGANAASSYATAAKNSASNASTYATNAKNSADSAADAASTAVTNKIKDLKYNDPSASTATSTTFISNISQTNGVISATKKTLPTANTTAAGIVKLTNTTGSTDTTTAATPNSVTNAINALGYDDPTASTSTSTTFISNISQTNGKITATKKTLPTFAGSSQPGIVSASEGLSDNYLLNATGGWTAIDEELDVTSTNPVQNKTLYNLETYHTLTKYNSDVNSYAYIIDDLDDIPVNTSIKLYFKENLTAISDKKYLLIYPRIGTHPRHIITSQTNVLNLNRHSNSNKTTTQLSHSKEWLSSYRFMNGDNSGYSDSVAPTYTNLFFTEGTVLEVFLDNKDGDFILVGDPIVGRYEYNYNYAVAPTWDITANAIVYASGLKIQWGNFTYHSASNDATMETYFPVPFLNLPSMSFTFDTNVGSGALDAGVVHRDTPYAFDASRWKLHAAVDGTYGYWQAIGY